MRISGYQATSTAIQNPFTFYYVQDNDWSSSHSYQFWNKNFTAAASVNNTATLKTIYSPSPSGFVEPKTAAFTGFTSTGSVIYNESQLNISSSFNKGFYFYTNWWRTGSTIFFDALGFRDVYSGRTTGIGDVALVGIHGSYWSTGASSVSNGCNLSFNSGAVAPQSQDERSFGMPCWSVKNTLE